MTTINWTIGCDAEVMLEKRGKLVSAVGILPSSEDPLKLPFGTLFYDNVLAEFTIEPAKNKKDFAKHIKGNLKAIKAMMANDGMEVRIVSSAHYPCKELQSDAAKKFGCSPDFDAYTMQVNEPSICASKTTLRSAGAHIHVGHPIFSDPFKIVEMAKMMDLFLGIPSTKLDNTKEARERRKLYGKAGAHRPKDYPGVEYRCLSNFWIKSEKYIEWIYGQTEKALTKILKGQTVVSLGYKEKELQNGI